MSNTNQSAAASKALQLLTARLGSAKEITTAGSVLNITFEWTGADLSGLFTELGAEVEVSMQLPALPPGRGEQMVMGAIDGMRFHAKCPADIGDRRRLTVSLYTETSDAATFKQRLESVHSMADSLFATRDDGNPNETLISYIVARLKSRDDDNETKQLAADLASVLANHLSSQVKMSDVFASQLAAATSNRR